MLDKPDSHKAHELLSLPDRMQVTNIDVSKIITLDEPDNLDETSDHNMIKDIGANIDDTGNDRGLLNDLEMSLRSSESG